MWDIDDKYKHFYFVQCLYVIILSVSEVLSRIEFSAELITTCSLALSAAILFPPGCQKKKFSNWLCKMLFIFTDPSIFIAVLSLYENMKWKIFSVCLFWTQHTTRLTTALGRETGWWNKLIFVQQRTFITHSNDDIFPFSHKIESHSLSHIYVFPPPDWWRDQFKFSTFTKYTDVCSASFSLTKKDPCLEILMN